MRSKQNPKAIQFYNKKTKDEMALLKTIEITLNKGISSKMIGSLRNNLKGLY